MVLTRNPQVSFKSVKCAAKIWLTELSLILTMLCVTVYSKKLLVDHYTQFLYQFERKTKRFFNSFVRFCHESIFYFTFYFLYASLVLCVHACIFIIRKLQRSCCPPSIMLKCYNAFIHSVMLYGFPSFCNAPQYLLNKLLRGVSLKWFLVFMYLPLKIASDQRC